MNRRHHVIDALIEASVVITQYFQLIGKDALAIQIVSAIFEANNFIDEDYHMSAIEQMTSHITQEDMERTIAGIKSRIPYDDNPEIHEFLDRAKEPNND